MKREEPKYETLRITFEEPISKIDEMFDDADYWGATSLKEWVESYESTRFTAIDDCTAIITSEYNMENVEEWLKKNIPIDANVVLGID